MQPECSTTFSPEHKAQWLSLIPTDNRIPRVSTEEFFENYYKSKKPCIIEGLFDWDCYKRWTPETLMEEFAEYEHTFRYGDGTANEEKKSLKMNLRDYLSKIFLEGDPEARVAEGLPKPPSTTEKVPYARHIGPLKGKIAAEIPLEKLFPASEYAKLEQVRKFLFVGAPSTKTNNHYDWSHNFVYCVRGIKHVSLQPPGSEQSMSGISEDLIGQLNKGDCFFVAEPDNFVLDLCHPPKDLASGGIPMHEHPILKTTKIIYSPLFPGDIVFFPAYWYHYFHNVTAAISVTTQTYV